MRQKTLQKEFYHLAKKQVIQSSETAKERKRNLDIGEALCKTGMDRSGAAKVLKVSRASRYRWQKRFAEEGWKGLEMKSRKPKRVRQKKWGWELVAEVQSLRQLYPVWGKEKIRCLLAEDGINTSVSTVGRIIRYLQERQAIPQIRYRKRWKPKRRSQRLYVTRKPKGYRVEQPGDIVQVDTLDLHPFPGVHFKHFTARDVVSRWDAIEAVRDKPRHFSIAC